MLCKRLCNVTLSHVIVQLSVLIISNYPCSLDTVVLLPPPQFCGSPSKISVRGREAGNTGWQPWRQFLPCSTAEGEMLVLSNSHCCPVDGGWLLSQHPCLTSSLIQEFGLAFKLPLKVQIVFQP